MGKVRKLRKKYQSSRQKTEIREIDPTGAAVSRNHVSPDPKPRPDPSEALECSLPHVPLTTERQGRTRRRLHATKKLELKCRSKMGASHTRIVNALRLREGAKIAKRRRPKLPQPLQLKALVDALPEVSDQLIVKSNGAVMKQEKHHRPISKKKHRQSELLKNMETFKSILSNKHYRADPLSAISNHLLRTVSDNSTFNLKKK